jgi:hypothetical protein
MTKLKIKINTHEKDSTLYTAVVSTANADHVINPNGNKLPTVLKNVQKFLAQVEELDSNPAAKMLSDLR